VTTESANLVPWVLASGRRSLALRALAAGGLMTAADVARATGRTVQNSSQALQELEHRVLAEVVERGKGSWKHYRLSEAGRQVAGLAGLGPSARVEDLRSRLLADISDRTVKDAFQLVVTRPVIAGEDETISDLVARLVAEPVTRTVYVVDDDGKLVGFVPLKHLLTSLDRRVSSAREGGNTSRRRSKRSELTAGALAEMPVTVRLTDSIRVALRRMVDSGLEDLPIVDSRGALLGELNGQEILLLASGEERLPRL
jgi:CBS-domain-containing membrane protein